MSRIVGYGICGPGEAKKYMKLTMEQFKRLCDEVVICMNNATDEEYALANKYGFTVVTDNREWGKFQNRIKQDLLEKHVSKKNPEWCVALDMDEEFDPALTKDALVALTRQGHSSYHTWVCNLWDDGYAPSRCFWKVQIWKWNGDCEFADKPLHPGLVPFWAGTTAAYAPYFMLHHGLKKKEDRAKRVLRYKKYDPTAKYVAKDYYDSLEVGVPVEHYDAGLVHEMVANEVATYHQPVKTITRTKPMNYVFVKRLSDGKVLDIPEAHLAETLKRGGFELFSESVDTGTLACNKCDKVAKTKAALAAHKALKHGT